MAPRPFIYELRMYRCKPGEYRTFINLTNEHFYRRTSYSTMLGYWSTSIGPLHEVTFLWQYESLSERFAVRQALLKDAHWNSRYVVVSRDLLLSQDCYLLTPISGIWFHPTAPDPNNNYYRLTMHRPSPTQLEDRPVVAPSSGATCDYNCYTNDPLDYCNPNSNNSNDFCYGSTNDNARRLVALEQAAPVGPGAKLMGAWATAGGNNIGTVALHHATSLDDLCPPTKPLTGDVSTRVVVPTDFTRNMDFKKVWL